MKDKDDVFVEFRNKLVGLVLTQIEASIPDFKQREALKSMMRQHIDEALEFLKDMLRGDDKETSEQYRR